MNGVARTRSALAAASIALAALLAAGCGTVPTAPSSDGDAAPAPDAGRARGGYWLDDGPGANPPANLDEIADAVPRDEPVLARTARPYRMFGRTYVPMAQREPFRQRGTASWYGRRFHGQPTATGERYDMYAMTAAHPTLPLPSYARVTHLRSGRSVVVRVNDRGPFLQNRAIDLSYAAARRLGFIDAGSAEVDIELLLPDSGATASAPAPLALASADPLERLIDAANTVDAPSRPASVAQRMPMRVESRSDGPVFLQLGAFSSRDTAEAARAKLARQLDAIGVPIRVLRHAGSWKVHAGPYPNRDAASAAADRVQRAIDLQPLTVFR